MGRGYLPVDDSASSAKVYSHLIGSAGPAEVAAVAINHTNECLIID